MNRVEALSEALSEALYRPFGENITHAFVCMEFALQDLQERVKRGEEIEENEHLSSLLQDTIKTCVLVGVALQPATNEGAKHIADKLD